MKLFSLIEDNPVFWYHIIGQSRIRGRDRRLVFGLLFSFIALAYLYLLSMIARFGLGLQVIFVIQLVMITLLLPAASHTLMSSEYEKATLESLILTRLSAEQIVLGKTLSRLIMVALLMIIFLIPAVINPEFLPKKTYPVLSYNTYNWVFRTEFIAFSWGFLLVTFGVWVSNRVRASLGSAALSYGSLVISLLVMPLVISAISSSDPFFIKLDDGWIFNFSAWPYAFNPFCVQSYLSMDKPVFAWGETQACLYLIVGIVFSFLTVDNIRSRWQKRRPIKSISKSELN
jgi:hypothetical protein